MQDFDFTAQSDTTQLPQSHHNCEILGHVGQQAPQAGLFCSP